MTTADHDAIRTQIVEVNRRFADAVWAQNLDRLAEIFTPDALVLPPNHPLRAGHAEALAFWGGLMSDPNRRTKSEFTPVEIDIPGEDIAIEVGHAKITVVEGGAVQRVDHGKYLVVWKRIDGDWKMHRDIFNGDGTPD